MVLPTNVHVTVSARLPTNLKALEEKFQQQTQKNEAIERLATRLLQDLGEQLTEEQKKTLSQKNNLSQNGTDRSHSHRYETSYINYMAPLIKDSTIVKLLVNPKQVTFAYLHLLSASALAQTNPLIKEMVDQAKLKREIEAANQLTDRLAKSKSLALIVGQLLREEKMSQALDLAHTIPDDPIKTANYVAYLKQATDLGYFTSALQTLDLIVDRMIFEEALLYLGKSLSVYFLLHQKRPASVETAESKAFKSMLEVFEAVIQRLLNQGYRAKALTLSINAANPNAKSLGYLTICQKLIEEDQQPQALALAAHIPLNLTKSHAFLAICISYLNQNRLAEALEIAHSIPVSLLKQQAFLTICRALLTESSLNEQILNTVWSLTHAYLIEKKLEGLLLIAQHLMDLHEDEVLKHLIKKLAGSPVREALLLEIISRLLPMEKYELVKELSENLNSQPRDQAFEKLCLALTAKGYFDQALEETDEIDGEELREDTLVHIADQVPIQENGEKQLKIICKLTDEHKKNQALHRLCIKLIQADKIQAALGIATRITSLSTREAVLYASCTLVETPIDTLLCISDSITNVELKRDLINRSFQKAMKQEDMLKALEVSQHLTDPAQIEKASFKLIVAYEKKAAFLEEIEKLPDGTLKEQLNKKLNEIQSATHPLKPSMASTLKELNQRQSSRRAIIF